MEKNIVFFNFSDSGFYSHRADYAKKLIPSSRGETEITDLNTKYINLCKLNAVKLGRGHAWLDTGTHESMLDASSFIATIESRQGLKVACLEEIAFINGFINKEQVLKVAEPLKKNKYGQYLINLTK